MGKFSQGRATRKGSSSGESRARERELNEYRAEQKLFFQGLLKKNREEGLRMEEERQRKETREAERQRKKERAREAKAAEDAGDGKGKYPRWTQ